MLAHGLSRQLRFLALIRECFKGTKLLGSGNIREACLRYIYGRMRVLFLRIHVCIVLSVVMKIRR